MTLVDLKGNGLSCFKQRQAGFAVGLEAIFLLTCILCVSIVTWGAVGPKITDEWVDIASTIGSLDQSYSVTGMAVFHPNDPVHNMANPIASWAGSQFSDNEDFCECCEPGCTGGRVLCIAASGPESHP